MQSLKSVVSVTLLKRSGVITESTIQYNWANPQRSASDDEIYELIKIMELEENAGVFMDSNQAQQKSFKKIEEWKKSNM